MSLAELLVVAVVALLVLGPQRLASVAQGMFKFLFKLRQLKNKLEDGLEEQFKLEQLNHNIERAKKAEEKHAEQ